MKWIRLLNRLARIIRAMQVANAVGPNDLHAIQVGRIRHISASYRSANALAQIICQCIQVGRSDTFRAIPVGHAVCPNQFSVPYRLAGSDCLSVPYRRPMQLAKSFHVPYRLLAGSDTYSCHTGWPCSWPISSPCIRLAGSDTYPCHTGRPMQLAQIISPCHTGLARIRCYPCHTGRPMQSPKHSSVPYRLAQIIQVGRIRIVEADGAMC